MDIATSDDVALLVDQFYGKVRYDDLLGPIFNDVAQVDWPAHMATLYSFWETMLLGTGTYRGAPFPKHAVLPVGKSALRSVARAIPRHGGRELLRPESGRSKRPRTEHCRYFCAAHGRAAAAHRAAAAVGLPAQSTFRFRDSGSLQSLRRNESRTGNTMKRITLLAATAAALLGLAGCDQKTSDDLKQKAEDARQTVETKAKEAKEAADRGIENAKPKVNELIDKTKEAAKDAEPALKEFGEKAKDVTQQAIDQGRELTNSAAEKLKEATEAPSPAPADAMPTPTP
jgi:hypothetical protein